MIVTCNSASQPRLRSLNLIPSEVAIAVLDLNPSHIVSRVVVEAAAEFGCNHSMAELPV